MGFVSAANKPLHIKTVVKVPDMIKDEALTQPPSVAREMLKVGAAIATCQSGSLRGPEVFMLDLGGAYELISIRAEEELYLKTLYKIKPIDLFKAPHVYIALMGKFKGEHGVRQHLVAVASDTVSVL